MALYANGVVNAHAWQTWPVSLCGLPKFSDKDVIPLDTLPQWPYAKMAESAYVRGKPGRVSIASTCPSHSALQMRIV